MSERIPNPEDFGDLRELRGYLPPFDDVEGERRHRQERLAATFRVFGALGFDEGVAGHVSVRDPEEPDHFWVNPLGVSFKRLRVSDLVRVDRDGTVVQGAGMVNLAAFVIHSQVHAARPDVMAAAHAHSIHGKAWSALGRLLDPITQDACMFYEDHAVFEDYQGPVFGAEEGKQIAHVLGAKKAVILRNHGLLTVGQSVGEAAYWFVAMERSCQAQLLAEAAGAPRSIPPEIARETAKVNGAPVTGWFSFEPLYSWIVGEQPDLLD